MKTENIIFEVVAAQNKLNLNEALKILLKNKNWKDVVKKVLSDNKDAGFRDVLLTTAVLALSSLFHTTSAEELISKIETQAQHQVSDDSLKSKIQSMIPYPINKFELEMLKKDNPLTGQSLIDIRALKRTLGKKVTDAMKNEIIPKIKNDATFYNISSDKLSDLILQAFKYKLDDKKYTQDVKFLKEYLTKNGEDMKVVYETVASAIKGSVNLI